MTDRFDDYRDAARGRGRGVRAGSDTGAMTDDARLDVLLPDGTHRYWSTHCRHDKHDACSAGEFAPGVPRRPAECKTCAAPCVCGCHR